MTILKETWNLNLKWYSNTVEYYLSAKRNTTKMDLKIIKLNKKGKL